MTRHRNIFTVFFHLVYTMRKRHEKTLSRTYTPVGRYNGSADVRDFRVDEGFIGPGIKSKDLRPDGKSVR
jgi:hypothetical protein